MRHILGISAYYHDSAAALLVDGRIVAGAQEERFSRKKNDERFPKNAVAFCLKQAGIDTFTILEKAAALGGTWRDNDYPGAACDVQSHLYSFSFEPNPHWSRMFAEQREIKSYLEHCDEKYELLPHLRYGLEVTSTVFD